MLVDQGAALTQHHFSMVRVKLFLLFLLCPDFNETMQWCLHLHHRRSKQCLRFVRFGTLKPQNNDRNTAQKHGLANSCQPREKRDEKALYKSFVFIFTSGSRRNLNINNFSLTLLCTFSLGPWGPLTLLHPSPLS